jgi:hypothetical protein
MDSSAMSFPPINIRLEQGLNLFPSFEFSASAVFVGATNLTAKGSNLVPARST